MSTYKYFKLGTTKLTFAKKLREEEIQVEKYVYIILENS
jgi:hypothetical protein